MPQNNLLTRSNQKLILNLLLATSTLLTTQVQAEPLLIFEETFGPRSRGELKPNLVKEPPPVGMGYTTDVPEGFVLKNWIIADVEADGPRRSFWTIPKREDGTIEEYGEQAGRSRNSIAFAGVAIPSDATHYVIEFRQRANDNDYIGFVLGAPEPIYEHDGVEFGYERQFPGTDDTVRDIYYRGAFGRGRIDGRAEVRRWADHRFEVRGQHVTWSQNGEALLAGSLSTLRPGGWFGIRQSYERGTRYDDVRITVLERETASETADTRVHPATVQDAIWNAFQERPEVADGWTPIALLPGNFLSAARLQWFTPLPHSGPAELRFTIASDDDESRTIEAVYADTDERAGLIEIRDAIAMQTRECETHLGPGSSRR